MSSVARVVTKPLYSLGRVSPKQGTSAILRPLKVFPTEFFAIPIWLLKITGRLEEWLVSAFGIARSVSRCKWRVRVPGNQVVGLPWIIQPGTVVTDVAADSCSTHDSGLLSILRVIKSFLLTGSLDVPQLLDALLVDIAPGVVAQCAAI